MCQLFRILHFVTLISIAAAVPISQDTFIPANSLNYASEDAKERNLPVIDTTTGTYQASYYKADEDIYVFKNIRFAKPPVGELRFAKPQSPEKPKGVQGDPKGGICPQTVPLNNLAHVVPQIVNSTIAAIDWGRNAIGPILGGAPVQEDCLFLDVFVPGDALRGKKKYPVVDFIHGGFYLIGSKDVMSDGSTLMKAARSKFIWVTANYRLGPFGFLFGSTVEADETATTNAGFYDQYKVLEWIRDNISKFGGDPSDVTAAGESAGGGSIVHHLTAFGGTQELLFNKVFIWSGGYDINWDRHGRMDDMYHRFETWAGCSGKGIECLRQLDYRTIKEASDRFHSAERPRTLGFGPGVDGKWVRQLPALEFETGNYAKNVTAVLMTHAKDEGAAFNLNFVDNRRLWQDEVALQYGHQRELQDAFRHHFYGTAALERFGSQRKSFSAYLAQSSFVCNNRWIAEAYPNKTWMAQVSRYPGTHFADIVSLFLGWDTTFARIFGMFNPSFKSFSAAYQKYIVSFLGTGDPNADRDSSTIEWPHVKDGPEISNVLDAGNTFQLVSDETNSSEDCDFWLHIWAGVTKRGGYAPPNAEVPSRLFEASMDI